MKRLLLFVFGLSACGGEDCTREDQYPVSVRADRACPALDAVESEIYEDVEAHALLSREPEVAARSVCWYRVERSEDFLPATPSSIGTASSSSRRAMRLTLTSSFDRGSSPATD